MIFLKEFIYFECKKIKRERAFIKLQQVPIESIDSHAQVTCCGSESHINFIKRDNFTRFLRKHGQLCGLAHLGALKYFEDCIVYMTNHWTIIWSCVHGFACTTMGRIYGRATVENLATEVKRSRAGTYQTLSQTAYISSGGLHNGI